MDGGRDGFLTGGQKFSDNPPGGTVFVVPHGCGSAVRRYAICGSGANLGPGVIWGQASLPDIGPVSGAGRHVISAWQTRVYICDILSDKKPLTSLASLGGLPGHIVGDGNPERGDRLMNCMPRLRSVVFNPIFRDFSATHSLFQDGRNRANPEGRI